MERVPVINIERSSGGSDKKQKDSKDFIHKALDVLTTPQQALVGMAEEHKLRAAGVPPTSYIDAAKTGMRGDYDWSRVEDDPLKAFAANMILDPVNLVPFTGYTKGVKALEAATKAKAIAGVRKVPILKKAVDEVGELFGRDYHAKHVLGMPELSGMRTEHAKALRELLVETKDPRTLEVERLLPRYDERRKVFRLLEEPMNGNSKEWARWKSQVDALDNNEAEAFKIAREFVLDMEERKTTTGLIDELRALGLEHRMGVTYAPRYLDPEKAVPAIKAEVDDLLAKLPGLDDAEKAATNERIASLREAMNQYASYEGNTLKERLIRSDGKLKAPGFTKERKMGPLNTLGHLADMFDQNLPRVMERERLDVAKALADREYLDNVRRYLDTNGWTKTAKEVGDSKDWVQLSKIHGDLADVYVPKGIGDEVKTLVEKAADPIFAPTIFGAWRRLTSAWKGVTLFYAPEFYSRQAVSNITLNHLAGMGVRDFSHNYAGLKYAKQFILDGRLPTNDPVMLTKAHGMLSEKQLYKAFAREGALGHGLVGEVDDFLKSPKRAKGILAKSLDFISRDNPVVTRGHKLANAIDGQSKMAHMLWRLSKGDTIEQAGASMRKFLYDPDMLLTPFEKKYLRDAVAPFWGWVKFNLPLQVEMLVYYPNRVATQLRVLREVENALGGPEPEESFMAEWMQNSSKMRIAWNPKTETWDHLMLNSWYPTVELEDATMEDARALKKLWGLITPLLKDPVEWMTGMDISFMPPRQIEKYPGEKGELLGIPMRKRLEEAIKFVRPVRIAEQTIEAYARDVAGAKEKDRILSSLRQLSVGRVQHTNKAAMKRQWEYRMEMNIRELKGIRNYYKKRGDKDNLKEIDKQIADLEKNKRFLRSKN